MTEQAAAKTAEFTLKDEAATRALAAALADIARPGLVVLLDGPVGASKTTVARGVIQTLLARAGQAEDVPSPTFTLVQTYETPDLEIWHADLYRLTDTSELFELGLDAAFSSAFCLIEWPDRLGADLPPALRVELAYLPSAGGRHCRITASDDSLSALVSQIARRCGA